MSQLGCIGSGNKLQKPKEGPWSLGEGKGKGSMPGEKNRRERHRLAPETDREPTGSFVLKILKAGWLGDILGEDLHRVFISFMLMSQNEIYPLTSSLGVVGSNDTNWVFVIYPPSWWFQLFILWLGKRSVSHLFLGVLVREGKILRFTR